MQKIKKIAICLIILFSYLFYQKKILISLKFIKNILNIIDISIIIPIYNSEKYLPLCLNSVISQTLFNIEIICINDGSKDNSSQILNEYKNKDNRIKIIEQKNQGSGIARNNGIKISKGKFITFMDSDDLYPNKFILEFIFKKAIENKVIICGGGIRSFVGNNTKIRLLSILNISFYNNSLLNYSNYQYDFFYQRFIYNKNFIKRNKLFFPNYLRYQDPPFFIKTMYTAQQFYTIKNITNIYRKNIDKALNLKQVIDMFQGLKECLELSEKLKLYQLYNTTLNRINMKLFLKEAKRFSKKKKVRKLIVTLIKSINKEIIKKYNFNFTLHKFYGTFF